MYKLKNTSLPNFKIGGQQKSNEYRLRTNRILNPELLLNSAKFS